MRAVSAAIRNGIKACTRLTHLALGGRLASAAYPHPVDLGAIDTLVLLTNKYDEFDLWALEYSGTELPAHFRSLTSIVGAGSGSDPQEVSMYAGLVRECEKVGATFAELERPREFEWLSSFREE